MSTGCSQQRNEAEIISYGITDNIADETIARPEAVHGKDDIYNGWNLLESTSAIPLEDNIQFGIEYIVRGESENDVISVEEVIIFPRNGLTDPDTEQTYSIDIAEMEIPLNEANNFCYRLETPWEKVSGTWIFQVRQDGKILAEHQFKVMDQKHE